MRKWLIFVLFMVVTAGYSHASEADNQKAEVLAKCVADGLAVAQYSQDPFWREFADSLWRQFYSYARQIYTGPLADIDKYSQERFDQLQAYGRENGLSDLLRKARTALDDPCGPLLLELELQKK